MKTSDFDYVLPPKRIAQVPLENRDESRLMVVTRDSGSIEHRRFYDIGDYLHEGDILVFNDSRVIPARLRGKRETGGKLELLLLSQLSEDLWESLVKPARKVTVGDIISLDGGKDCWGEVLEKHSDGVITLRLSKAALIDALGEVPLPPYIYTPLENPERYQTVYSKVRGSTAAPTAGLHFTPQLLRSLGEKGINFAFVTLHVGLDTFRPVRSEDPRKHHIHREYGEICEETVERINKAKLENKKIVCVGTTTVRLLETAARDGTLKPFKGWTDLYILPGFSFHVTDAMVTNFHLPRSTLLMMVSAFGGTDLIREVYREGREREEYRFFSFGDAMLIL